MEVGDVPVGDYQQLVGGKSSLKPPSTATATVRNTFYGRRRREGLRVPFAMHGLGSRRAGAKLLPHPLHGDPRTCCLLAQFAVSWMVFVDAWLLEPNHRQLMVTGEWLRPSALVTVLCPNAAQGLESWTAVFLWLPGAAATLSLIMCAAVAAATPPPPITCRARCSPALVRAHPW